MNVLLLYYRIIASISTILAFIVFYLILFKSPSQMNNFKWHVLNIQSMTFAETFYWCVLCAPMVLTYPLPHGYPTGILSTVFDLSTNIQGVTTSTTGHLHFQGVAIFLLGEIVGVFSIAFVFRYHLLMPRSDIPFLQSFIEKMPILAITIGYGNGFIFGFLTYMSFLDEKGVDDKLHQADLSYLIPTGAATIGGIWVYPWAGLALLGYSAVTAICVGTVLHSKKILTSSNQSRSVEMHRQAFRSLILQSVFLYGIIAVPCSIVSIYMIFGPDEYTPYISDVITPFCIGCYTLKSMSTSLVACYTIRPYREYIISCFRPKKNATCMTFGETFYWCFLCSPMFHISPLVHGYPTGIMLTVFNIPSSIQGGIAIFFVGEIMGSLAIAFVFRYHMLMPSSDNRFVNGLIQKLPTIAIIIGYGNGLLFGFLTYMSFVSPEEAVILLTEEAPAYIPPKGAATVGGIWLYPWAALVLFGFAGCTAAIVAIMMHSNRILKSSGQLSGSAKIHRQAFRTLILQMATIYGVIATPCVIACLYMIFGPDKFESTPVGKASDIVAPMLIKCYTLKSALTSLVICYTIRPYRQFILRLFGFGKNMSTVRVTRVSNSK